MTVASARRSACGDEPVRQRPALPWCWPGRRRGPEEHVDGPALVVRRSLDVTGGVTPPGSKPPSDCLPKAVSSSLGAPRDRSGREPGRHRPSSTRDRRRRAGVTHEKAAVELAGEGRRQGASVGLVDRVRLGEAGALHRLRGHGDRHRLVAGDPVEGVVEGVGGVHRVEDLLVASPIPATGAAGTGRGSRGHLRAGCRASTPGRAAARAMVAACAGIPRWTAMAEIRLACGLGR